MAKGKGKGAKLAKTVGRMLAAGELEANAPVTWSALAHVLDVAECTSHGMARREELENAGVLRKEDRPA